MREINRPFPSITVFPGEVPSCSAYCGPIRLTERFIHSRQISGQRGTVPLGFTFQGRLICTFHSTDPLIREATAVAIAGTCFDLLEHA
ncbi:hypothetical protein SCOR_24105 [Sulfidibacter corallicola]|uniref:Uncharacterized protein n=1 Tax=Sulfidibacter corallicola TaxID=2818388 RepID=A0A8A4TRA0_SULCO|nr:hypothetical protein [Sulfidibacter corallicola]QTD52506.1 hypothetical protein J3U87_08540 [Sulfidibacter corallicola]